jgi:DNA polymerase-3 subunit gamma/tau
VSPTLPPDAPPPLQTTALGERWAALVAGLLERQSITALVRELAMQAELVAIDGPVWRLRVERESLRTGGLRDKLQMALNEASGEHFELELEAGVAVDSPARRDAALREQRQQAAEQVIHNDPLVQEMMARYRTARIVPGSIKPHEELKP